MPPTRQIVLDTLTPNGLTNLAIGSSKLTSEMMKESEIATGAGTTVIIVILIAMTGMTGTAGETSETAEVAGATGMIEEIILMIDRQLTSGLEVDVAQTDLSS